MVNGSWTEDHINKLWHKPGQLVHKIYPPCDVQNFKELKRDPNEDEVDDEISFKDSTVADDIKTIISIGQFRPEKDHMMQLRAFATYLSRCETFDSDLKLVLMGGMRNARTMFELRKMLSENEWKNVKLVIIGGSRNEQDNQRIKELQDLTRHLSVEQNIEFKVNIPFDELKCEMSEGLIGLHTMWNEHFGIGIVEMMAAGLLTVAHRSGGPLLDIIIDETGSRNGFLASSAQEYAAHIAFILGMTDKGREGIRERARSSVNLFSSQKFDSGWTRATDSLFPQQ
jgi:alpha-1,2-mannosyltransferase